MDDVYISQINKEVELPKANEFGPLQLGQIKVWPPVILAPMAGVTNYPFRSLCQAFGAGLYVSEMITARPLVDGREKTLKLADFGEDEPLRSLQLYGVDPYYVGEAVKRLVAEGRVDHIDMNFGCPVPKVTRKGGGSAIPARPALLRSIVRAAVQNAEHIPVTIKFRKGVDANILTYLDAGKIGEDEGCKAVCLHGRTAADLYDGHADWESIALLKQHVTSIPVLGNGDIWEAYDALRMMRQTGCDGVVIGRGCLGRPWLFRDLNDVFNGRQPSNPPTLGEVTDIMAKHLTMLCDWFGTTPGIRIFRKHATWYTKGYRGSAHMRHELVRAPGLADVLDILSRVDRDEPFPPTAMRVPRGKTSGRQKVRLPDGWLDMGDDLTPPGAEAADMHSGG